jgi:hypothetical protein
LIGDFRDPGRVGCEQAPEVGEHDSPRAAECRAVPFGIYDLGRSQGRVTAGAANDTSRFAVKATAAWGASEGRPAYPRATRLLILADGGGTSGNRCKAWQADLQEGGCGRFGLAVTACHYPPGRSKWNPIEYRLFSQIGRDWAGVPLRTLGIMLARTRGTTTTTGLRVPARLDGATYPEGQKVSREAMGRLNLQRREICPDGNYTLSPRRRPPPGVHWTESPALRDRAAGRPGGPPHEGSTAPGPSRGGGPGARAGGPRASPGAPRGPARRAAQNSLRRPILGRG